MSVMFTEPSHKYPPPFSPTSSTTAPKSTTFTNDEEDEPACEKRDCWIEPPLKAPAPSFQDDGLKRTHNRVFRHMAPLGQSPPAGLNRQAKLKTTVSQIQPKRSSPGPKKRVQDPKDKQRPASSRHHSLLVKLKVSCILIS